MEAKEEYQKALKIIELTEALEGCQQIEDLFSSQDKERWGIGEKSSSQSSAFKNSLLESEIQEETKKNFYQLLEYLKTC